MGSLVTVCGLLTVTMEGESASNPLQARSDAERPGRRFRTQPAADSGGVRCAIPWVHSPFCPYPVR